MTYPTPGSLGADLFEMTEQQYVERFGDPEPPPIDLSEVLNVSAIRSLQIDISEVPDDEDLEALMGKMTWHLPDRVTVTAHFPPPSEPGSPWGFSLLLQCEAGVDYHARLEELGFPMPDGPQLIVKRDEQTSTYYFPGPLPIAHLVFVGVRRTHDTQIIGVSCGSRVSQEMHKFLARQSHEKYSRLGTIYYEGAFDEIDEKLEAIRAIVTRHTAAGDFGASLDRDLKEELGVELLLPGLRRARILL